MGVRGESDWLYARHAERALATVGPTDELYIHFGHFGTAPQLPITEVEFRAAQRALDERVLSLARVAGGQRLADVGCGVGGTLAHVDASFADMELHGVNVDPLQIAAARSRVACRPGNRLTWHVASALQLPFGDRTLDRVLAIECIPHFGSRARFLGEAARALVPGGLLALTDFVPHGLAASRARGELPEGLEEAVAGLGPFEDFWGEGPDYAALVRDLPLTLVARVDATAETAPTYGFLLRAEPKTLLARREAALEERGLAALAWAQTRGLVRMEYLAFERT